MSISASVPLIVRRILPSHLLLPRRAFSSHLSPLGSRSSPFDVIIVGGGHNGLVASAYLSRLGLKVLVIEKRHQVGGAACTEEIYPSYKYSRASYLFSLFRPFIFRDLSLSRHGVKLYHRDPSSFTPTKTNKQYLMMGASSEANVAEIRKFSVRDSTSYPLYESHLSSLSQFIQPLLDAPPPSFAKGLTWEERVAHMRTYAKLGYNVYKLGRKVMDFHDMMTSPAAKILDKWFESEPLKVTLATDAVIGAMISHHTPGSGYVLFHHVMGEVEGRQGSWSYVEGGMGAVATALERAAKETGVTIRCNETVSSIIVENNVAKGVELSRGERLWAHSVLSNAHPHITFLKMLAPNALPTDFLTHIKHIDTTSSVTKINVSLSRLPNFKCYPTAADGSPGPQHRGTVHFVETCDDIETAYRDAQNGIPSRRPLIEMTIPSSLDPTLAPPGHHVASLFVQYTPYNPIGGWTEESKTGFAKRCFGLIDEYCPGFSESILHYEILTPPDLESEFGLIGGNIFHTTMSLDQLFWLRPVSGYTYRTPIDGLYMCGASTHPGGGVMGASGKNAADCIAWDWKRRMGKKIKGVA